MRFKYGDVITLPDSTLRIMVVRPEPNSSSDALGTVLRAEKPKPNTRGTIWGHAGEHTFFNSEHEDWTVVK